MSSADALASRLQHLVRPGPTLGSGPFQCWLGFASTKVWLLSFVRALRPLSSPGGGTEDKPAQLVVRALLGAVTTRPRGFCAQGACPAVLGQGTCKEVLRAGDTDTSVLA